MQIPKLNNDIGEEEKNQSEKPQNVSEENKEVDTGKEKEDIDPTSKDAKLSFLHIAKLKVDSSLQGDSWMYNELMTLKKRMGKMQQDQDTNQAKIM